MPTIIITGARGGIGAATADRFGKAGWSVVGTSRDRSAEWPLDITSEAECHALVTKVADQFGRLDAVFNNAGYAQMGAFDSFSLRAHRDILAVNLLGAMALTAAALPVMREAGRGTFVHMGSVVSHLPAPFMGSYAASKHALEGFSKTLDHELQGTGIRSILIRAGFMRSDIAAHTAFARAEDARSANEAAVTSAVEAALAKADDPDVVAKAVLRACTDPAAAPVIDAGREARMLARLSAILPRGIFARALRKQFGLAP
ncbi:MAG: SDR family NAD(P)-dependent oxidoreductase [Pseudomonadota bacterium]